MEPERGGLVIHMLLGHGIAGIATEQLERLVPQLTAAQCRAVIDELLDYERLREPLSVIEERDDMHDRLAEKWVGRWTKSIEAIVGDSNSDALDEIRRRLSASTGVLVCDLAVHAYSRDHGRLRRDVGEFVPAYLAAIPLDPHDGTPLNIVLRETEYLAYSVGPNGRDNSGQADRDTGDWPVVQRKLAPLAK